MRLFRDQLYLLKPLVFLRLPADVFSDYNALHKAISSFPFTLFLTRLLRCATGLVVKAPAGPLQER